MQKFAYGDSIVVHTEVFGEAVNARGTYIALGSQIQRHQAKIEGDDGRPIFLLVEDYEIEPDFDGNMRDRLKPVVEAHCGDRMVDQDMDDFIDTLIQAIHGGGE